MTPWSCKKDSENIPAIEARRLRQDVEDRCKDERMDERLFTWEGKISSDVEVGKAVIRLQVCGENDLEKILGSLVRLKYITIHQAR